MDIRVGDIVVDQKGVRGVVHKRGKSLGSIETIYVSSESNPNEPLRMYVGNALLELEKISDSSNKK